MRRIGSLLLVSLGLILTGCGGEPFSSGEAPAPADLAADAFAALMEAGSAHYVVDLRVKFNERDGATAPLVLHAEGEASATALTAEGNLDFGFGPMEGKVLVGPHDVFLRLGASGTASPGRTGDGVRGASAAAGGVGRSQLSGRHSQQLRPPLHGACGRGPRD